MTSNGLGNATAGIGSHGSSLAKISKNNVIIKDGLDRPIAHAELSARLSGHEINAFVIDPAHRGRGYPTIC